MKLGDKRAPRRQRLQGKDDRGQRLGARVRGENEEFDEEPDQYAEDGLFDSPVNRDPTESNTWLLKEERWYRVR